MNTIYIGPHDRKVRFPNERKQDDMPYVPEWTLHEALAANRDLVRQMAELSDHRAELSDYNRVTGRYVMASLAIGVCTAIILAVTL